MAHNHYEISSHLILKRIQLWPAVKCIKCSVTLATSLVLLAAGEPWEAEGRSIMQKDTHLQRVFGLQVDFQGCRFGWLRSRYSHNDSTDTGGVVPAPVWGCTPAWSRPARHGTRNLDTDAALPAVFQNGPQCALGLPDAATHIRTYAHITWTSAVFTHHHCFLVLHRGSAGYTPVTRRTLGPARRWPHLRTQNTSLPRLLNVQTDASSL
ncbi:hypothetical protein E2C01_032068 [Portunus trituberculatus]|uniref:Uncharacterized protein n=1 Tax=Portunus trituberculatus TaxID=210409 RepID=A0A5B7EZX5_PORTR|nr:hypothetical protein [Portunus trituberculatus]